jgi:hypothetical protein
VQLGFEQTLTASDSKKNIPFPFEVPEGTTQLTIRLSFSPWTVDNIHNMLTLSVFDPSGFRGAGHRHGDRHEVVIHQAAASPGYRAGPIPAGEWSVVIDTHMIMPGAPCPILLEVTATDEPVKGSPRVPVPGTTAPRGRGWYRGDVHAHTIHSDAQWDIPGLVEWARARQLDFCTLSDHNAVSGLPQMDAARDDYLLTMGGMELTTFWGHALALGLREWVDWRTRPGERAMEQIAAEVTARGGLFIIAHPAAVGDPYCTGCRWVYPAMMPGTARVVEAWNGPWWRPGDNNEQAQDLIYSWLNQGHRLALTAGTDNHGHEPLTTAYGFNVVYAEELSETEILRAIRAGHLYLSSGPALELTASAGDRQAMMGDTLETLPGVPVQVTAQWHNAPPDMELNLVVDGAAEAPVTVGAEGTWQWALRGDQIHWCLLTLRAPDRTMLAMTNPIYFDGGGNTVPGLRKA